MQRLSLLSTALLFLFTATVASAQFGGPVLVRTSEASIRDMTPVVQVAGTVLSKSDATISSEISGRLLKLSEVGTVVEPGDSMAQVDDTDLLLQQDELVAELAGLQSRARYLASEFDRLNSLSEKNAAARNLLEQTRSDRDQARSNATATQARLSRVEDQLRKSRVEAPFGGVVTERFARVGEVINSNSELLRLVDPADLEVVARAPLDYFDFISRDSILLFTAMRRGQPVEFSALVTSVVPVGDETTHLFEVRARLDERLPVGQSIRVRIPTAMPSSELSVPRDALVLRPGTASVFTVDEEGKARQIQVRPGIASGDYIAVSGDLAAGQVVIVRGAERLRDGMEVMAQPFDQPGEDSGNPPANAITDS